MSNVLAKDRKPSGLEFLVYPHDLEVYTVQNAKAIPKTHTFMLKVPLCESARNINKFIRYANTIYPDNIKDEDRKKEAVTERLKWEKRAIMEVTNFIEILTVASEVVPLSDNLLEKWTELAYNSKQSLINRNNKDKERYL